MPLPVEVVPRCWEEVLFSWLVDVVLLARRVLSVAVWVLLLERPLPEVELPVVAREELPEVLLVLLPVVLVARDEVLEEDEVVARDEVPLLLELLVEVPVLVARDEVLLPVVEVARDEVLPVLLLVVEEAREEVPEVDPVEVVEPVVVLAREEVPVEVAAVPAFCWAGWDWDCVAGGLLPVARLLDPVVVVALELVVEEAPRTSFTWPEDWLPEDLPPLWYWVPVCGLA